MIITESIPFQVISSKVSPKTPKGNLASPKAETPKSSAKSPKTKKSPGQTPKSATKSPKVMKSPGQKASKVKTPVSTPAPTPPVLNLANAVAMRAIHGKAATPKLPSALKAVARSVKKSPPKSAKKTPPKSAKKTPAKSAIKTGGKSAKKGTPKPARKLWSDVVKTKSAQTSTTVAKKIVKAAVKITVPTKKALKAMAILHPTVSYSFVYNFQ